MRRRKISKIYGVVLKRGIKLKTDQEKKKHNTYLQEFLWKEIYGEDAFRNIIRT